MLSYNSIDKDKDRSRSTFKSKKNIENLKEIIIEYLDNTQLYKGFSIKKKYIADNNILSAQLLFNNHECKFNYMDRNVREICTIIAHDLRDYIDKNIFFDLYNGVLYFYI